MDELSVVLNNLFASSINPLLFVFALICILLSAFFSGSETAISTANPIRLKSYIEDDRSGAKKALYLVENFEETVTTILIGNNIVNIALTTVATYIFISLVNDPRLASILNTIIVTLIVLIFGEIIPKQSAKILPEDFACHVSKVIYALKYVFMPIKIIIRPFQKIAKKHMNDDSNDDMTEDEFEDFVDDLEEKGVLEQETSDLIQSVLSLDDKDVGDIMTPRVDMIVFDLNDGIEKFIDLVKDCPYTRIPICDGDKDNIIGKVHIKDFLSLYLQKDNADIDIKEIMTDVLYVSETMKVNDMIRMMKEKKQHICIVSGEYGGTEGLVTMEDGIEVLVGEIFDEHDVIEVTEPRKVSDNQYLVSADYNILDLLDKLELPEIDTDYSSIGGFITEKLERMPVVGDKVDEYFVIQTSGVNDRPKTKMLTFEVKSVKNRRIINVLVTIDDIIMDDN